MTKKAASIIRRTPLPGEELKRTFYLLVNLAFEICHKARKLGREHRRNYNV